MINYAKRTETMRDSADVIKRLFESMTDPSVISFGGGAPAAEALPVEEIHEIAVKALARGGRGAEALQYGSPRGLADLRLAVCEKLLAPKGIAAEPEDILISGGGMEAVNMAGHVLLDSGDVVLVESPTFVQAVQAFESYEAKCVACETDDDGFVLENVEAKIKQYKPKLIYVIPTFQNPSGRTMVLERRKRLAELADKYDTMVLEDDPYCDLRYSGVALPPVKAFDKNDKVIYANSFSKIFSPGSRLGFVYAAPDIMKKLYNAKTATNSHASLISQVLCAEFFNGGYFEPHLAHFIEIHRERRDVMMECIEAILPNGSHFVYPDGGLFTWVELPEGFDTTLLLDKALEKKVAYVPGEKFFTFGQPVRKNCMRVSFGGVPPQIIREGIERLGEVLKA